MEEQYYTNNTENSVNDNVVSSNNEVEIDKSTPKSINQKLVNTTENLEIIGNQEKNINVTEDTNVDTAETGETNDTKSTTTTEENDKSIKNNNSVNTSTNILLNVVNDEKTFLTSHTDEPVETSASIKSEQKRESETATVILDEQKYITPDKENNNIKNEGIPEPIVKTESIKSAVSFKESSINSKTEEKEESLTAIADTVEHTEKTLNEETTKTAAESSVLVPVETSVSVSENIAERTEIAEVAKPEVNEDIQENTSMISKSVKAEISNKSVDKKLTSHPDEQIAERTTNSPISESVKSVKSEKTKNKLALAANIATISKTEAEILKHPPKVSELSTPKSIDYSTPPSNVLDPIDLNIVNLESSSDLGQRARSSPNLIGGDFSKEFGHRRSSSVDDLPDKAEDPEDRLGHGRQYSLNLATNKDHVIIEIEQERVRKSNERGFKIIVGLLIFGILFTVTFFLMAWEMGYLQKGNKFSIPVFY